MTSLIPSTGLMPAFLLLLVSSVVSQYHQGQQFGSSFQQSGGSYQQSGGGGFSNQQSRYQTHVVVPPQIGGQYREQRIINVQENIQGTAQGGGYGYGAWAAGSSGSASGYQYNQNGFGLDTSSTGSIKGSQVDLRLISYSNGALTLSNTTTCKCPIANCNYIPQNQQNQCYFSFVIVISAADQSIQYIQSNFYPMPSTGIITTGNWTNQYTFLMNTKPVSIDIFVQHLGVVIDSTSAQLLFFNHLTLVDSFVVDLLKFNSNGQNGVQTLTLTGQQQSTSMQLSLNVQCINSMMGPYCDMICPTTSVGTVGNTVICFSNRTDTYSACKWNTYKTQVTDCIVCTHGATNGTCNGAYIAYDGVSYAFRTWTIVLGCLLGIALLLILCLILSYIICYRIRNRDEQNKRTTTYDERKIDVGSNQALISNDEWASRTDQSGKKGILTNKRVQQVQQQQDEAGSEDSYRASGVQQTIITTSKTSRREHVV